MKHLSLDDIATVHDSKAMAAYQRFKRVQRKWYENGAEDSEPNSLLARAFLAIVKGAEAPKIASWELYQGMVGTKTANRELTGAYDKLVGVILKDIETARLVAIYHWGE